MGVPPAGRCHEGSSGHPVGTDGVDDVAIAVEIATDHGVNAFRGLDGEIEGDRVVPVGLLFALGGQQVVERPHGVSQRLRLWAVGIRQQDAVAVLVLALVFFPHLFQLAREQLTREIERTESRCRRLGTEEIHQRLVVHPIEGAVLARPMPDLAGDRQRKEIAGLPTQCLAIDHTEARATDDIKDLAAGMAGGGQFVTGGDVKEVRQEIGPGDRVARFELL